MPSERISYRRNGGRRVLADSLHNPPAAKPNSGRPLPDFVRETFERAYGHNFRNVRVHEGDEAGQVNANACTRGNHLHFQRGR